MRGAAVQPLVPAGGGGGAEPGSAAEPRPDEPELRHRAIPVPVWQLFLI